MVVVKQKTCQILVRNTFLVTCKDMKLLITLNSNGNVQRINGSGFFSSIITHKIKPMFSTEVV